MKHPVFGPGVERGRMFICVHSKPEINEAPGLVGWMDTGAPTITRATHGSSLRTAMHGWREVPRAAKNHFEQKNETNVLPAGSEINEPQAKRQKKCASKEVRTPDLGNFSATLSQLSYRSLHEDASGNGNTYIHRNIQKPPDVGAWVCWRVLSGKALGKTRSQCRSQSTLYQQIQCCALPTEL